jgi:hypothetical protein
MTAYLLAGHLLNLLAPAALIMPCCWALSHLFPRFLHQIRRFRNLWIAGSCMFYEWVSGAGHCDSMSG